MDKQLKGIVSARSFRCYSEILEAIRTDGGEPFLAIIKRNMTSLVKQVLTERKHRAPRARGV
jgi:hypothetical protein